jgi:hypothetical protein
MALWNDDRAKQFGLSHHVAENADHQIEVIADVNRGQPPDSPDAQAARGIGAEHRDTVAASRIPAVQKPSRGEFAAHSAEQIG